jgi:hypothetical protein
MSRTIQQRKKVVLFGLAVITGGLILQAYQLVVELRIMRDARFFEADVFPARLRTILLLSLLVAAAGLAIGRRWGFVTSSLGLVGALLGYIYWFYDSHRSFQILAQEPFYTNHPEFVPPNSFGLIGARWWEMVLLMLFVALLIWEVITVVKMSGNRSNSVLQS